MDENEKLMARMERINRHYKEYAEEIESAKETDEFALGEVFTVEDNCKSLN